MYSTLTKESRFVEGLNEAQKRVVLDTQGYLLVLAGAGSGKTSTMTRRVGYLLEQGVKPWQILTITFTNKAAREMRERIISMCGEDARDIWIGTFHGVCIRILSRFGKEIGLEKFTIIDDKEQKKIVKQVIEELGMSHEVDLALKIIGDAKNELQSPTYLEGIATTSMEKDFAGIYDMYEQKKAEFCYIDFDDCIYKTVQLLQMSEVARDTYQNQFRYVMVDEMQDSNNAQFELLSILSAKNQNLMAVGDDSQSIYAFRGANIGNILGFETYFPGTKKYLLEQNYRSTKTIVDASNAVIANNENRLEKVAFSGGEQGSEIVVYKADDDAREADFVASVIKRTVESRGDRYDDFMVLYRTQRQSRAIETALTHMGVPYGVSGNGAFYNRKEIKDIVGYLRILSNGMDVLAFERVINTPKRGIGDTTIGRIQAYASECCIPFKTALENVNDIPKVTKKAKASIGEFMELIKTFEAAIPQMPIAHLINKIQIDTGYFASLQTGREEDDTRIDNIKELMTVAQRWEESSETEEKTIENFLLETSLVTDMESDDEDNKVSLLTTHGAKGLEAKHVFIVGMEETIFPHARSLSSQMDLEEERRICYVAMTRAKKRLYITHCTKRFEYNQAKPNYNRMSRFINEIPKQFIKKI